MRYLNPALIAAAALALPTVAHAERPPVAEHGRGGTHGAHAQCETVAGNPNLEAAAEQTTTPDGNAIPKLCPSGQVRQVHTRTSGHHHAYPGRAAPETEAGPEQGFYHVSQEWEASKIYEAWFAEEFSSPVIPSTAKSNAHSVVQDWIANEACNAFTKRTLCTLEIGWEKEPSDQAEGYKGSQPFCFYTASDYQDAQTGECPITSVNATDEAFWNLHLYPTDGSAESRCGPHGEYAPCAEKYDWTVKQTKGAWWIATTAITGKLEWIGYVPDTWWGHVVNGKLTKPFVAATGVSDGGEVFDYKANEGGPRTPMGNGNKGACTCATDLSAMSWKRHRTAAEGGGIETSNGFWSSDLASLSQWPQRYTMGATGVGDTEVHVGG